MKSVKNNMQTDLPQHVAIIMDGNGRWAEQRGLPRHAGHEQGSKTTEDVIRYARSLGIRYVTLYAFSSENWRRPKEEVDAVMSILERYIKHDVNELVKNNIQLRTIGDINKLPNHLINTLKDAELKTAHCDQLTITLALSYGAWDEMVYAIQSILSSSSEKNITMKDINEQLIRQHLYTKDLPDPDLFIRTGGELRLSNFLLMQISYSELYFSKTLWPDFRRADLDQALSSYSARKRRFGNILSV